MLDILVPEMQMLFRLALGEIAPFTSAFEYALERHKKYWSRREAQQSRRLFALGLAIAPMHSTPGCPSTSNHNTRRNRLSKTFVRRPESNDLGTYVLPARGEVQAGFSALPLDQTLTQQRRPLQPPVLNGLETLVSISQT